MNLGRKELGIVSIVREPNYPWFDRNSQPKPDRPRGKKWVGKNDGSHTSSKTIVACFTTADLTPAFITGPVEPGLMGEETTVCPLTPPTFSRTRSKTFSLKNLLIQWNLDLRKPDLRKNLDLRKIVGTTDFLVHKLFDLRKIF